MAEPDLVFTLEQALQRMSQRTSDFDLNKGVAPTGRPLTPASVLIAVSTHGPSVILTKRSARLKHHPGQIAFPGGKQDPGDKDAIAAALREAEEEIGLHASAVRILGTMPTHETVTGFCVTPVLALLDTDFEPTPEAGEVAEVFDVPLDHVTDLCSFRVESRIWQGTRRYFQTVPYGPYYIWGATARILFNLAQGLAK